MHAGRGAGCQRLALWLCLGCSSMGLQGQSVLLTIENRVEVAPAGRVAWSPGHTNQALKMQDRVRTGMRSRATVRLSDLSLTRLDELTTLEIQPPSKAGNKPVLDQKSGVIYFLNRERPTEMEFRTPQASGAIRGTEFNLAVTGDGRTILTMVDGEVALSNPQGELVINSGEQATVQAGQAPTKTAVIDAVNIIQWALYYPAIVDVGDLGLTEAVAIGESVAAYRSGELLRALAAYPEGRQPTSDGEKVYLAGLLLAVGRVDQSSAMLDTTSLPLASAVRQLIATVKGRPFAAARAPRTATEWMAESYQRQSVRDLEGALRAAREAVAQSPEFGFGRARVAELEFGFGRTSAALAAIEEALRLSPRNPQAHALRGFALAANNEHGRSLESFEEAIAVDNALGSAWLGRGLAKIRLGDESGGREDLQAAAILEPTRSAHRSYLGKAFSHTSDAERAEKELGLAKKLDENDPTPWLYSSLLKAQQNRINEAVSDLERSQVLNDNRSVFRSSLLLDQDRAVRSANLAAFYRDAAMAEVSVREAQRAVSYDYGNYSAHLFLASSYDALRDPKGFNLRYETPFYSELLVANLLAPVGGGSLSQSISQQEYSRFFEGNRIGIFSSTDYLSYGYWQQSASQYGNIGNTSYAVDLFYRSDNGQRPNNDLEQLSLAAKFKQQLTAKDSVYVEAGYYKGESGDVAQYYDQAGANVDFRAEERQEPYLLAGYHREWSPGVRTLFLAGRFDNTLVFHDPTATMLFVRTASVQPYPFFAVDYDTEFEAYTTELQQILQRSAHTLIVGGRYQTGWSDTQVDMDNYFSTNRIDFTNQNTSTSIERASAYAYHQWEVWKPLQLSAGITYDWLRYPRNNDFVPVNEEEDTVDKLSPKAGFILTPMQNMHVRGAYTRSLGGVYFDTSVRLEPTQVAGFNQAFRSLTPESVSGPIPATEFETFAAGVDYAARKTGTYLGAQAELLRSDAHRTIGTVVGASQFGPPTSVSSTRQKIDFEEKTLLFTVNQLLGHEWSVGTRYRLSVADMETRLTDLAFATPNIDEDVTAILHQLHLHGSFNHPSGFFAQAAAIWTQQSNQGYAPDIPGDDFWQFNVHAGWRFFRRHAELRVGLLNIADQDYQLNPLNLYNELPRNRTLAVSFKFYF